MESSKLADATGGVSAAVSSSCVRLHGAAFWISRCGIPHAIASFATGVSVSDIRGHEGGLRYGILDEAATEVPSGLRYRILPRLPRASDGCSAETVFEPGSFVIRS